MLNAALAPTPHPLLKFLAVAMFNGFLVDAVSQYVEDVDSEDEASPRVKKSRLTEPETIWEPHADATDEEEENPFPFFKVAPPFSHGNDAPVRLCHERARGTRPGMAHSQSLSQPPRAERDNMCCVLLLCVSDMILLQEGWIEEGKHKKAKQLGAAHEFTPKLVGKRCILHIFVNEFLMLDRVPIGLRFLVTNERLKILTAIVKKVHAMMSSVIYATEVPTPNEARAAVEELFRLTDELLDDIQTRFLDRLKDPLDSSACAPGRGCTLCRAMPWIARVDEIMCEIHQLKMWVLLESLADTGQPFFSA